MERKSEHESEWSAISFVIPDAQPEHKSADSHRQEKISATLVSITKAPESKLLVALPNTSKLRDFLRHNRLQVLGSFLNGRLNWAEEPRKVVLYRCRKVAAYHCLLHFIPLSAAIALLVLRWTHYWIGLNPPNSTTLQFVAKLHELSMQVSIVEVIFCIVRTEAIHGFVPLGALSGALQATQLSYLWSLDFWSMFHFDTNTSRERKVRRVFMVAAIPALLVLTALVGPSSAVLMIPEPGSAKLDDEATTAIGPIEFMFPATLGLQNGLNMTWTNFNTTLQRLLNTNIFLNCMEVISLFNDDQSRVTNQDQSFRNLILRTHFRYLLDLPGIIQDKSGELPVVSECTAAIPTLFATRLLNIHGFFPRATKDGRIHDNSTASINMPYPFVEAQCYRNSKVDTTDDIKYIHNSGKSIENLGNVATWVSQQTDQGEPSWDHSGQVYKPVWLPSTERGSLGMIALFFGTSIPGNATLEQKLEMSSASNGTVWYESCSLAAYWNNAESKVIVDAPDANLEAGTIQTERTTTMDRRGFRQISLNLTGLDMLWDPQFSSRVQNSSYAAGLVGAFALAIAEVPTNINQSQSHAALLAMQSSPDNINVTAHKNMYGYGYTADSTALRLSLAVISIYCIVAIVYIVYILTTGAASTSWNSAIEVVALALQSKKPEYHNQGHTSAGIASMNTLRQNVGIRVNNNNELELVFANDRSLDKSGLRKVERNTAY